MSFPKQLEPFRDQLAGRSMIVSKTKPLHGGMRRARLSGRIRLERIPEIAKRLRDQIARRICNWPRSCRSRFSRPRPRPNRVTTRTSTWTSAAALLGDEMAEKVEKLSLQIYSAGRDHASERGIIVADTKFEFGTLDGEVAFDRRMSYAGFVAFLAGRPIRGRPKPAQFRQTIRPRLSRDARLGQNAARAHLPPEMIEKTSAKYVEAFERLTGE